MGFFSKISEIFQKATVVVVAGSTSFLGIFTVYDAVKADLVMIDTIRVPEQFTAKGFTDSISTQRLLDEVSLLNVQATTTRDRKNLGDKLLLDVISKSEVSEDSSNIKAFKILIQKLIGREPQVVSGEISISEVEGKVFYVVRIRSTPPRRILVDMVSEGDPGSVLEKAALGVVESLDPIVAISVYRSRGNLVDALRVANLSVMTLKGADLAEARLQRSFVYSALDRFDEAITDIEFFESHPLVDATYGHASRSLLYSRQQQFEKSMEEGEKLIQRNPSAPQGYYWKMLSLRRLGRFDEAIKVAEIGNDRIKTPYWPIYFQLGQALNQKGSTDRALDAYDKAIAISPKQASVHFARAEILKNLGRKKDYLIAYRAAYNFEPDNLSHIIGVIEAEIEIQNYPAIQILSEKIEVFQKSNSLPAQLRNKAAEVLVRARNAL